MKTSTQYSITYQEIEQLETDIIKWVHDYEKYVRGDLALIMLVYTVSEFIISIIRNVCPLVHSQSMACFIYATISGFVDLFGRHGPSG